MCELCENEIEARSVADPRVEITISEKYETSSAC